MSTRARQWLDQLRVPYTVVQYEHQVKGAVFAAQAAGFPLAQTIKTLVVALSEQRYVLALMPGDRQLALKKIAAACNAKRAAMADAATAERLTGYLLGGISPFGIKKNLPVVMDRSLTGYDRVLINGGRRGTLLQMAPVDIVRVLATVVVDLAE